MFKQTGKRILQITRSQVFHSSYFSKTLYVTEKCQIRKFSQFHFLAKAR